MEIWHAIVLAIIEGLTEFLPVSSTGHMIIGSSLMGISDLAFTKLFEVNIQFGTILSVLVLYWKKFLQSFKTYRLLFLAWIPTAILGFLLNDYIDAMLESIVIVAVSLILGGVVLLFVDQYLKNNNQEKELSDFGAIRIGFFQAMAMVPGVSRSAATILGGMFQGLNRKDAAEFSFLLAVPTMAAAAGYKLLKAYKTGSLQLSVDEIQLLLIGNLVGFLVGIVAIKSFISFLTKNGFKVFGIYRIVLGFTILALVFSGVKLNIV